MQQLVLNLKQSCCAPMIGLRPHHWSTHPWEPALQNYLRKKRGGETLFNLPSRAAAPTKNTPDVGSYADLETHSKVSLLHDSSPYFYRGCAKVQNFASIFDPRPFWITLVSKRSNISGI